MPGAQIGDVGGKLAKPSQVRADVFGDVAVRITWTDASDNEAGFRVDRRIGDGRWTAIAYRPPRIQGDKNNPQMWIDYLAPPGKPLAYRVVAVNGKDDDRGVSDLTPAVTLASP